MLRSFFKSWPQAEAIASTRAWMLALALCGLMTTVQAQHVVKGRVWSAQNQEALIGVNVVEADQTDNGTSTDLDGNFTLTVQSPNAALVVTYTGYKTQKVALDGRTTLDIYLEEGVALDEIVVTALGIKREEKALGYSVQSIGSKAINNVRPQNALNALTGKVAGLQTVSASNGLTSSTRLTLRGETSLNINNNSPLIVIDGIPINNQIFGVGGGNTDQSNMPTDYGNGAAEINPNDVESISVLKGAAASALYGSRGGNGVILITTKSGKGKQGLGVTFSSSTMFTSPLVLPEQQREYGGGWGLTYYSDYGTNFGPRMDSGVELAQDGSPGFESGEVLPFVHRFEIADFFETGLQTNNQLAISGGNENGSFRFSYNNSYNEGIVPNTNLKRNNFSINSQYKIADWASVNVSATYINSASDNLPVVGYGSQGVMYTLLWNYNNVDMDWLRDYWNVENVSQDNIFSWGDNPFLIANENINAFNKNRLFGKVSAQLQLTDALSLMLRTGTDYSDELRWSRRPVGSHRYNNGMYREQGVGFQEVNADFLLTYTKTFGDFSTVISAGANRMNQTLSQNLIEGRGLAIPGIYTLGNINVQPTLDRYRGTKRINSAYAFANLGYRSFLYLDLTARNDWSSTLPTDANAYFYPSASLSFIASEVLNLGKQVDYLKLRANYAMVGNDTDPFQLSKTYQFATLPNSVTNPSQLPNAALKPEISTSFETGVQAAFWGNRLNVDFSYYNTLSRNQIIFAGISPATGFDTKVINAGEIQSQGVELALQAAIVQQPTGFNWNIGLNYTRNRAYVNELDAEGQLETFIIGYGPDGNTVEARPGGRMGDIYGQVFQRSPQGDIVYGSNGLPLLDPTRQTVGNYNPDYMIGLFTDVSYKGLSFNVLFDIRRGGVLYSYTNAIGAESGILSHSLPGRETGLVGEGVMLDADGNYVPNTTVVAPETWYYGGYYNRVNAEANTFDASFVKLREFSIAYDIPASWLQRARLRSLSIALVGNNVAVWSDVPHVDPEAHALNGGTLVPGFEVTQMPSTRAFGIKLNAGF